MALERAGEYIDGPRVLKNAYREDADKDGSLAISNIGSFVPESYDALSKANPTPTTEIFSYYKGGLTGTLVATLTIVYVDSSKNDIVSVVRT